MKFLTSIRIRPDIFYFWVEDGFPALEHGGLQPLSVRGAGASTPVFYDKASLTPGYYFWGEIYSYDNLSPMEPASLKWLQDAAPASVLPSFYGEDSYHVVADTINTIFTLYDTRRDRNVFSCFAGNMSQESPLVSGPSLVLTGMNLGYYTISGRKLVANVDKTGTSYLLYFLEEPWLHLLMQTVGRHSSSSILVELLLRLEVVGGDFLELQEILLREFLEQH